MLKVLGNGVYGMSEAARILGIQPQKVRAWFHGWPGGDPALLRSDYPSTAVEPIISFLDLVDAAVSTTLRQKHGVSIHMIRRLRGKLSKQWRTRHPFAREEFYTDETGRNVFCTIAHEEDGPKKLIEILKQQFAIPEILLPFLKQVQYSPDTKLAQLITLMGRVVLDPRRRFGKPIVRDTGMPTGILYDSYWATQSEDVVADWYSVTADDVREAVEFETGFCGLAA